MEIYCALPVVLIGDSGQHDPEIYRRAVERDGARILAVYIRDVSKCDARIRGAIEAMNAAISAAGSDLVLASNTVEMAEHAAARGIIAPSCVDLVRGRQRQ
jgi:phosphatidate phosphatase APP1